MGDVAGSPGRLVGGRYRLLERLGSQVWKARDEHLHIDVAATPAALPQAGSAARLRSHPHVVAVHDAVAEDGVSWIVTELVAGHSLEEEIRAVGRISPERGNAVAAAVLSALAEAHAAGIVHGDVSPGNVLLADGGRILLSGFGVAVHDRPERPDGSAGGPEGDLFSLGVTLYRALEGAPPSGVPAPAPRHAGDLGPLVTALLRTTPGERPTATAALAGLPAVTALTMGPSTVNAVPPGPAPAPWDATAHLPVVAVPPPAGRRASVVVGVVVAAAAVLLIGGAAALTVVAMGGSPRHRAAAATSDVDLAANAPVTVSSQFDQDGWGPAEATNGDTTSSSDNTNLGWSSQADPGPSSSEWIEVDLASARPVDEVELYPRNDPGAPGSCFPADFTIETSADGATWTTAVSESDYPQPGPHPRVFSFPATTARYVKVTGTGLTQDQYGQYYFQLKQIEVFDR